MSKFGLLLLFHPLPYVITISSPIISALAPGIELVTPATLTPASSFIRASVISPTPAAFI